MSLSSAECLGISPTASQENITNDILHTLMFPSYNSVGGVCWMLSAAHPMVNDSILGTDSEFHYKHIHLSFTFTFSSLISSSISTSFPWRQSLAMTYSQISLLSLHSNTSFPFFASHINSLCFHPISITPDLSETWVLYFWDDNWRLSPHHRITQVSRRYRAFSQMWSILIFCCSTVFVFCNIQWNEQTLKHCS